MESLKRKINPKIRKLKAKGAEMIGAMEKGIEAAKLVAPPRGIYEGVDLRVLPKYISFRAALLHNQLTLQYVILFLAALLIGSFIVTRVEVYGLYDKLRMKEYILAPGVQDFTPASAQTVPDNYVQEAAIEYLHSIGNFTAGSIDEQYRNISESMGPQLKIRFLTEADTFKARVKAENISESLTVTDREIRSTGNGFYQVTTLARKETYVNNEFLGNTDEAIEMVLQLQPPKAGKRWFLQINHLSRQKAETFRARKGF